MNSSSPAPDSHPAPEAIEAAAAAWLSLRDRGMDAAETAEFVRWLQKDPQHAAIFAELDAVWKNLDRLGAVVAPAGAAPPPDADLLAPRVRPPHRRAQIGATLAVAAAAAIFLFAFSMFHRPPHTAETAVGAFQQLDLPDGSVAQLNTDSAIDIDFSAAERRVRVVRGEVFFNVTKNPSRPFIVTSGRVAVRAVGTAFNVRCRGGAVEVLVTEGQVRVDDSRRGESVLPPAASSAAPALLVAGERAIVALPENATASGPVTAVVEKVAAPATLHALAWQERRLEFDAVPLAEVAREFNRYNRQHLQIADPGLAARRFSGTFRADGFESFVRLLENDFGVTATRTDHEIILRPGR